MLGPEEATDVEPRPPAERGAGEQGARRGCRATTTLARTGLGGTANSRLAIAPPGRTHPGQLGDGGGRISDVAEQVGEGEGVEGGVGEGQVLALTEDEGDAVVPTGCRPRSVGLGRSMSSLRSMPVIRASVRSASSRATPAGPVATSRTMAGRAVDHVVDHLAPPPPVLAE